MGVRSDRPKLWTVVAAGIPITANQYHCATVPDGPNCELANGEYERIEVKNRAADIEVARLSRPMKAR